MSAAVVDSSSGTSPSTPAAEARAITQTFGPTVALDDVTLAIRPGTTHGLVGRNGAGKSTLVSVLTGLIAPDSGSVFFGGEPAPDPAERELWRQKVACVYQQSTVIGTLSIAENLFLNDFPDRSQRFLNWPTINRQAEELMGEWGIKGAPDTPASELSVGQRQLIEIARALRLRSRFIILDEPTAQLEGREIDHLFSQVQRMQDQGVTFMYISHHLDEVYEICHDVSVLRDGRLIVTSPVESLAKPSIVEAMVGSGHTPQDLTAGRRSVDVTGPGLKVDSVSITGACEEVSLHVSSGEVVGLAGLVGSGTRELAEAIVGLRPRESGEVLVSGVPVPDGRVDRGVTAGVGFVPEDRHLQGFCPNLSLEENLTASILSRLGRFGMVEPGRRRSKAARLAANVGVVASSLDQPTSELSGGNQQKTVMGRALASDPQVLVLVHPTAGVDIASKEALLRKVLESDLAVLVISDELDELAICDRVLVMFGGRITAEFAAGWDARELVASIEGVQ